MILQVELTNRCNFRCILCPHGHRGKDTAGGNRFDRPLGDMSEGMWRLALRNASHHAERLTLGFFGEQTIHPRVAEFFAMMKRPRRYRVVLFTNASRITRADLPWLRAVDVLQISMDADDSEMFELLCPGGKISPWTPGTPRAESRHAVVENVLTSLLAVKNRPIVQVVHTMSSLNVGHAARVVAKWIPRMRRGDTINTKRVISYGGVLRDPTMGTDRCRIPDEQRLTVAWDGRCTPCNLDVDLALNVGTLSETNDVRQIMGSAKCRSVLAGARSRKGICANCHDANNHTETRIYKP